MRPSKFSNAVQVFRNARIRSSFFCLPSSLLAQQFSSSRCKPVPAGRASQSSVRIYDLPSRPVSFPSAESVLHQIRWSSSILGELANPPGAIHKKIRRGRGPSSGKGKTSGRGQKGQKARGKVPAGFQGGQTPLNVTRPDRGTNNENRPSNLCTVNIDRIQEWIDQGRISANKPITLVELLESRCIHQVKEGVKLLARNSDSLKVPIHITVSRASASAIAAIEKAGGSITTRYYTKFSIKQILDGTMHPTISLRSHPSTQPLAHQPSRDVSLAELEKFPVPPAALLTKATTTKSPLPTLADGTTIVEHPDYSKLQELRRTYRYRLPDPIRRVDLEYYRDPAHRGYLRYEVGESESPSLFYAAYEPVVVDGLLQLEENNSQKRIREDVAQMKKRNTKRREGDDDNVIFAMKK